MLLWPSLQMWRKLLHPFTVPTGLTSNFNKNSLTVVTGKSFCPRKGLTHESPEVSTGGGSAGGGALGGGGEGGGGAAAHQPRIMATSGCPGLFGN